MFAPKLDLLDEMPKEDDLDPLFYHDFKAAVRKKLMMGILALLAIVPHATRLFWSMVKC